ncbi:MAG: hypothetical protein ACOY5R_22170 [Pseudomonadota bacterium]
MKAKERAALQDVLDRIQPLGAYGIVRTGVILEMLAPASGLPIPLGWIDDEGRLSIDAIAAHVPIEHAQAYARDIAKLMGARTARPNEIVLLDTDGNRPLIAPLVEQRAAWADLLEKYIALFQDASQPAR